MVATLKHPKRVSGSKSGENNISVQISPGSGGQARQLSLRQLIVSKMESGQLKVKILGLIPIVKEEGAHVDQAELLRWLGESFWFPTNLLPSDNLSWDAVDGNTARLNYQYRDIGISYLVSFNDKGEMTRLETARYRQAGEIMTWVGKVSDYKYFDGFLVPTHIEASWIMEEGEHQYVDFYVETIEYQY